ncbi:hypothetical protein V2J09_020555 [Rumex salicifolius]
MYRVDDKRDLRREKVRQVISYTETCSDSNKAINIGQVAFTTMLNILSNTFFSIDMADLSSDHGCEFKQLVWALMVEAGTPNISDFFPFLKAFDLQGSRSRSTALYRKTFKIFGEMIDKKMEMRNKNGHTHLLSGETKIGGVQLDLSERTVYEPNSIVYLR